MIDKLINSNGNFARLLNAINNNEKISVFGFTSNEQTSIFFDDTSLLFVASSVKKAYEYYNALINLDKTCEIIIEPFSPYYNEITSTKTFEIYNKLNKLKNKEIDCLVVTSTVLTNKFLSSEFLNSKDIKLVKNKDFNFKNLSSLLTLAGYKKTTNIANAGDFSVRGDIVDIYRFSSSPIRVSFFGNSVEFIKELDLENFTNKQEIDEVVISCGNILALNENDKVILLNELDNELKNVHDIDNLLYQIKEDLVTEKNIDTQWFNVFNQNVNASIFDYLPQHSKVIFDEPKQVIDTINAHLTQFNNNFNEDIKDYKLLKQHKNFYFTLNQIINFRKDLGLVAFGSITTDNRLFAPQKVFNIPCATLPSFVANKNLLYFIIKQYYSQNFTIVVFAGSLEYANKLHLTLQKEGVLSEVVNSRTQIKTQSVNIVTKTDNQTFGVLEEKVIVIGTDKLLKNKPQIESINDTSELTKLLPQVNDFVVHNTHGIGKCVDLTSITVNNVVKDYIVIEYAKGDKLFLPVEQIGNITKYVGSDKEPTLNKLGGVDFARVKQKVKNELKETAQELIVLYGARLEQKGIKFNQDDEIQVTFENEFIYDETPDQLKAIEEVKHDMQSERIMDRLICGDVGYGKTEVAIRAAFKAVISGYQVAVLCPTTILSQQHYNTFISRMQNFGVNIAVLNRFKTQEQQKQAIKQLANGEINIIVGTHRLLSNDIKFNKLGLLIIDEEQRFGVADKEKIKLMKKNIDVLTLSATPIPRSLHMSLIGVRDISVIDTPPPLKMPVITHVIEYNDRIIEEAIKKELERGGQTLIVFNNIGKIYDFYAKVKAMLPPTCKISVAHGQMSEIQLENEILNLYNGYTNVLISTTLIENGIDLPTANTLIVINSDMLGLSQLYQLKGRVGRSTIQAYAYFTYDSKKLLNEQALKRLQAIAEYTELGDGYKIALRDLEIRGAGSIFGHKQHGHLLKVGYAMYVKLLQESLAELKGEKIDKTYDVKIDTEFSAHLPNYYVGETLTRLKLYNEISKLKNNFEIEHFLDKMLNTYGEVPSELYNLCYVAVISNVAKKLPLRRIYLKKKEAVLYFDSVNDTLLENFINVTKIYKNISLINNQNLPTLTLSYSEIGKETFLNIINLLNNLV